MPIQYQIGHRVAHTLPGYAVTDDKGRMIAVFVDPDHACAYVEAVKRYAYRDDPARLHPDASP